MAESASPVRLQKFLARAGVASRRGSEDLMSAGRVTVNGEVIRELGSKVDPSLDVVAVDGHEVTLAEKPVYLMLNKPGGTVSTMSDPHARRCVAELVAIHDHPGLFPVGRLDADTTGLLLFTTDGEFAHRILHPSYKVYKRYIARVERVLREGELRWLRDGVMLDDGLSAPAIVDRIISDTTTDPATDVISISIREGRKRQVRRMFETIGHPVITLERTEFGPLMLGDLKQGACRELDSQEVSLLLETVDLDSDETR
jgi:23S rRNA pseudouridine2605 synthase